LAGASVEEPRPATYLLVSGRDAAVPVVTLPTPPAC
jgi:hypothetical protein